MIISDGKNNYPNNEFSSWEWSVPILQTHILKIHAPDIRGVVEGFIDEETLNLVDDYRIDD